MFSPSVVPLTVSADRVEQVAELATAARAGRRRSRSPPSGTCPTGRMLASTGVCARELVEARRGRASTPARRAIAIRCTIALVEPPSASTAVIALSNARCVEDVARLAGPPTPSRRCACRSASPSARGANRAPGIDAAPGSVRPSASAALVIVEAVPIVMQWPGERAMPSSISLPVVLGDVAGAQLRPVLPGVGAASRATAPLPVAAQHRARRHEDGRQVHRRSRPSSAPGVVLSQPPISTAPSAG